MIISADSHFNEDKDFWSTILNRSDARIPYVQDTDNGSFWRFGEYKRPLGLDNQAGFRAEDLRSVSFYREHSHFDLKKRRQICEADGIDHEIMLPSGAMIYTCPDQRLRYEMFLAYNEFCSSNSDDFYTFIPMLPSKPSEALKLLTEPVSHSITNSYLLPLYPSEDCLYSHPTYSPIFSVLNEKRATIVMHAGGLRCLPSVRSEYSAVGFKNSLIMYHGMETLADLYFSGSFLKYPNIKFVFSEIGTEWLDAFFNRLRYCYERYRYIDQIKFGAIDEYLDRIYFTFQTDFPGRDSVFFSECKHQLMFGSDFPHAEAKYPGAKNFYRDFNKNYGNLGEYFFMKNAADLYNISLT